MKNYNKEEFKKISEEKKEKLTQDLKTLISNFKHDPKHIEEYAEFVSKFYIYSGRNTALIYNQNPYANYVGSFNFFKERGLNIRKGEKGINILVPVKLTYFTNETGVEKLISHASKEEKAKLKSNLYPTRQVTVFKVGSVFDISQTDCKREDFPKLFHLGSSNLSYKEKFEELRYIMSDHNVNIYTKPLPGANLKGYYSPSNRSIYINELLDDTARLTTLTHEIGHALLHNYETVDETRAEIEADVLSIFLHKYIGLDVEPSRISHLKSYAQKCEDAEFESYVLNSQNCFTTFAKEILEVKTRHREESYEMEV